MDNLNEKSRVGKTPKKFSQIALSNMAIKVLDELIKLEGSNRLGGSSLSRADVLNDFLVRKGAEKIRDFYYAKE